MWQGRGASLVNINPFLQQQHPVSWQTSSDGTRLIGHLILKKDGRDSSLGLKVVGGQPLPHGGRGAVIEKVKRGSIAEREGGLRAGNFSLPVGIVAGLMCCG